MNLKPKCKPNWHLFFSKNFIAIYIALALVLVINQIIFTVALKDREKAKAFNSSLGSIMMSNLGDSTANPGSNNFLLAEFWMPMGLFGNSTSCDGSVALASNPCIFMVDADGSASAGAGVDDDGAQYVFDLEPNALIPNLLFQATDGLCTDSLSSPACVYIDSDLDCNVGTGSQTYVIGAGCATGADIAVAGSTTPQWLHSELVNANTQYDYGPSSAASETIWILLVKEDTVLAHSSRWDYDVAGNWQNDVPASWNALGAGNLDGEGYIDPSAMGYFDGLMAVVIDKDGDMKYADAPDTLLDADGTGSAGIGADDDGLTIGTPFTQIKLAENVCINNFSHGLPLPSTIIYVDGNGDCIPGNGGVDNLIRDDIGAPLAYTGAFPFTYLNAAAMLVYADTDLNGVWTYGAGSAATESLWLEEQGSNVFSHDVDILLEADGTGTLGIGADDDAISRGAGLNYLIPPDNICLSFTYIPFGPDFIPFGEDIYQDGSGDCIPGNGGVDTLLLDSSVDGLNPLSVWGGVWSSLVGIAAYYDSIPDGIYTFGAGAPATETLWATFWYAPFVHSYPSYTPSGDNVISGSDAVAGDNLSDLSTSTGPSGFSLIFADSDKSGSLSALDNILEDDGNIATGPAGVPNGVIDRLSDRFNKITFKNLGTLQPSVISNLKLYLDFGAAIGGSNGRCDNPAGSVDDIQVTGNLVYDATTNQWVSNLNLSSLPGFVRFCLAGDISTNTGQGGTFIPSFPALTDNNTNGVYDAGDGGLFLWSQNDGPTGGSIDATYTITIPSSLRPGSGGAVVTGDSIAPGMPTNIQIIAADSGSVVITWTDPSDADLSQIMINEEYLGNTLTSAVNKGVQLLNLAGRLVGGTYEYSLRAVDTSGNYSSQVVYIITIPSFGETIATEPLYMPAPIEPQAELPAEINVGDVLKSEDSSALYYIGPDGKRHLFPTEFEYLSWYPDYSNVKTVNTKDLNSILKGGDVYIRPGTYLIKSPSSPRVYEVLPGAVLNWVTSERIAIDLYGAKWQTRLVELASTSFDKYVIDGDLKTIQYTNGHVISYYNGKNYLIDDNKKCQISSDVFVKSRYKDIFVNRNVSTDIKYDTGAAAAVKDMVGYFD